MVLPSQPLLGPDLSHRTSQASQIPSFGVRSLTTQAGVYLRAAVNRAVSPLRLDDTRPAVMFFFRLDLLWFRFCHWWWQSWMRCLRHDLRKPSLDGGTKRFLRVAVRGSNQHPTNYCQTAARQGKDAPSLPPSPSSGFFLSYSSNVSTVHTTPAASCRVFGCADAILISRTSHILWEHAICLGTNGSGGRGGRPLGIYQSVSSTYQHVS